MIQLVLHFQALQFEDGDNRHEDVVALRRHCLRRRFRQAGIDATTRSLVVAVATKGITATEAHVHLAPPGVPGPVIIPLVETSPGSGIWIAKATLTEAQYNALVTGNLYLNVHSAAFPEGEIRGQLLPVLQ